jgi:dihydropteroate synthase
MMHLPPIRIPIRAIGARTFDFSRQIAVMAVINRTPDSFYDRGKTFELDRAIQACLTAAEQGADWVDIGGVKFGPGPEVPIAEEIDRVVPVIRAVAQSSDVVISVDTFWPEVARAAIEAGANVVNDTTGIHYPDLADVVADSDATLVVTHSLATPRTWHPSPEYDDVAGEIAAFLSERAEFAQSRGIPESRLIVDPGHDLNKNTVQSLEITRRLDEICALGFPTLVAVSNKDFIGESLDRARDGRVAGSLAAATLAVTSGARIVRMHNVQESVDAMRMVEAIMGWRSPVSQIHNMGDRNPEIA